MVAGVVLGLPTASPIPNRLGRFRRVIDNRVMPVSSLAIIVDSVPPGRATAWASAGKGKGA